MSVGTTMSSQPVSVKTTDAPTPSMVSIAKRQRLQDIVFHRLTQSLSLLVLVALLGIIVSLFIYAWPAFHKFGIQFIWRAEWDIINEEFGAAIAIAFCALNKNRTLEMADELDRRRKAAA